MPNIHIWLAAAAIVAALPAQANLVRNGSFENASLNVLTFRNLMAGSTVINDWQIGGGAIDYVGAGLWNGSDGGHSVDLDGSAFVNGAFLNGWVSQTFATDVGADYEVDFDLSGNPGALPLDKVMEVSAAGSSAVFSFRIGTHHLGGAGAAPWTIPYDAHAWHFTATAATTTLTFRSLTHLTGQTGWGAVIDNVVVERASAAPPSSVPEPASLALAGLGLVLMAGARLRRQPRSA